LGIQIPETNTAFFLQPLSITRGLNAVSHLCEAPDWHVDCGFEADALDPVIAYTLQTDAIRMRPISFCHRGIEDEWIPAGFAVCGAGSD
jgi:hypothetical protein